MRPLSFPSVRALALLVATSSPIAAGCASSNLLAAGASPPELTALDQHGTEQSLGAQRGKPLVVYFYPKDGTPGCTEEACAFRDAWSKYAAAGVMVYGVSADDVKSKEAFSKEQKLPFPVLADPDHVWATAFGVGNTLGMDHRVTFLLDRTGKIAKVYPDVDPGVHAAEVLVDAKKLP